MEATEPLRTSAAAVAGWERLRAGAPTLAPIIVLALLTLGCLLPFLNKAFHIDDPVFLWPAQQIQRDPLHPFDRQVNWYGYTEPLGSLTIHPPLVSYYIAAAASVAGWSEAALHAAFLLPAFGVIVGTYLLARRLCAHPVLAAVALLISPGFWTSATTVMTDVPMLSFWVWTLVLWLWAMDQQQPARAAWGFIAAGIVLSAAAACKYPALQLVVLLAAAGLRRRWWPTQIPALILPVLAAFAMRKIFGGGGALAAASYASANWSEHFRELLPQVLIALAFLGGAALPAGLIVLVTAPVRTLIALMIGGVVLLTALWLWPGLMPLDPAGEARRRILIGQFAIMVLIGTAIVSATITDLSRRRRHRDSLLLALWIGGVLFFAAIVNWSVNGRTLLPLLPAVSIIAARRVDVMAPVRRVLALSGALVIAGVVAGLTAVADYRLAGASRRAAQVIHARARQFHGTIWFCGHWGLQWYMEALGARAFDPDAGAAAGDLVVIPSNNANIISFPPGMLRGEDEIAIPGFPWLATQNARCGAGFYTSLAGPMPFTFGPVPPERFRVYRLLRGIAPSRSNVHEPSSGPAATS